MISENQAAGRLVVNADDFGLTEGTNKAILDAHQHGIVTSTSLLANSQSFDHAVQLALTTPTLGVGVHLTLTEGKPLSKELSALLPTLPRSNQPYVQMLLTHTLPREPIRAEFAAQIQRIVAAGITPTHVDGHKYIQLLPGISEIVTEVAKQFSIPIMRAPQRIADSWLHHPARLPGMLVIQAMSGLARKQAQNKGLCVVDQLLGFVDTGHLTRRAIQRLIATPHPGITELLCHPAYHSGQLDRLRRNGYRWIAGYDFAGEAAAVGDPMLRTQLQSQGWQLVNFASALDLK